jgi:L-fuculose-phosphate aldolase
MSAASPPSPPDHQSGDAGAAARSDAGPKAIHAWGGGGFASEDQARLALVRLCQGLTPSGLNAGKSGNVSLRWHRGGEEGMLITPSGLAYEQMSGDDIVWMPLEQPAQDAEQDEGLKPPPRFDGAFSPSSEWRIHRDLYLHRPEAGSVLHLHSPHATTLACLPRIQREGIPAFHYMIAVAGGADLRCAPYATFGSAALSLATLAALDGRRACLMAHHGMLALGRDPADALALATEVEALCRLYWQALCVAEPGRLDDAEMARVLERFADYGRVRPRP